MTAAPVRHRAAAYPGRAGQLTAVDVPVGHRRDERFVAAGHDDCRLRIGMTAPWLLSGEVTSSASTWPATGSRVTAVTVAVAGLAVSWSGSQRSASARSSGEVP